MRILLLLLIGTFLILPGKVVAQAQMDGLYEIHGYNSELGDYDGNAWVRGSQVQRLLRWKTFRHMDHQVESIWSGTVDSKDFIFTLSLSNVLTSYNDFSPASEEFRHPLIVTLPRTSIVSGFTFSVKGEGTYAESWHHLGEAPKVPLWQDQRKSVEGVGDTTTLLMKIIRWIGLDVVINWYRSQPEVEVYKDRPEYQQQKQYFIQDHTDADFYAKNPHVLRVINKTLNPLSLAEAVMRRNAYAPTFEEKAQFFGKQTLTQNLNAAGLLEFAVIDHDGNKIDRKTEYDSALWSAMYAWSEVLRYEATKDPLALVNFRRVLDGILTLVEITGDPENFARALAISPLGEDLGPGWIQGQGKYAHLKWRQGGNNDMAKGLFITLALAHKVVDPTERTLCARIQKVSRALLTLKPIGKGGFNGGIAHGLIALWEKDEYELVLFSNYIQGIIGRLGDITDIEDGFYLGGIADWSGVHLSAISNISLILLSQELIKVFPYQGKGYLASRTLKIGQDRLKGMEETYQPAQRDFLTIISFAFSRDTKDTILRGRAREALWTLKEVPAPRFVGQGSVDLQKIPQWSLSAWPWLPWKALKGARKMRDQVPFSDHAQGAYSYPIFETQAWSSSYLWKEAPFSIKHASNPQVQPFSADYLMLYWLARNAGLLGPGE